MWMRTLVNYQYTSGGTFMEAFSALYADGGMSAPRVRLRACVRTAACAERRRTTTATATTTTTVTTPSTSTLPPFARRRGPRTAPLPLPINTRATAPRSQA